MKLANILKSDESRSFFKRAFDWIVAAIIGAVVSGFFTGKYLWTIFISVLLLVCGIIYVVILSHSNSKYDILKILRSELNAGNYRHVIMIGYSLSRQLHLSGRNTLRYEIGKLVDKATTHLQLEQDIRINDDKLSIAYIKAKNLIDDLGWTSYKLQYVDIAIEKISAGIKLAKEKKYYTLAVKGYRHLVGILDEKGDFDGRNEAIESANKILYDTNYRNSFKKIEDYEHVVAEFEYAYAKTLIDDNSDKALESSEKLKIYFSTEVADDPERYVKTLDLIGDIYAHYKSPTKLKIARETYLDGISECEKTGRTERLIRTSIDYIDLLLKMYNNKNVYSTSDWEQIDSEELDIYNKAYECSKRVENKYYISRLKKSHKKYLRDRKARI
ncbi:MAG: hypothetical protein IJM37_02960 [Lachnospiraceae bacterium]|nr:hypothetical protein [Lachnospiraceae bacterium]